MFYLHALKSTRDKTCTNLWISTRNDQRSIANANQLCFNELTQNPSCLAIQIAKAIPRTKRSTHMSAINKLDTFINSEIYRRKIVKHAISCHTAENGWEIRSYKDLQLDASYLLDYDTPPYYYINGEGTRLVIVWMFDPKENSLKDYCDYALSFSAELIHKDDISLALVQDVLNLFYVTDEYYDPKTKQSYMHEMISASCTISRKFVG